MRIDGARLTGFRNLVDGAWSFSAGVNILLGCNGQGKTNLLEALDYPALGRSHRGARNDDLIRFGSQHLHVALDIQHDDGTTHRCEFGLERGGASRFKIDGEVLARRADLVGRLATVFFQPESIELVRGGPELRRRFADQSLAGLDPVYLGHLVAYQRALRQKSALLRDLQQGLRDRRRGLDEVSAWNRELARQAAPLCRSRSAFAVALEPCAAAVYDDLTVRTNDLTVAYRPHLRCCRESVDSAQLEADILAEMDYIGSDEIRRGRPLAGPHRDDFEVRLAGRDLRVFGSQGEARSAAVSLILAQSDVVFQMRRIRPVLFLDDIFSELDRERARRLQDRCARHHQVFVATARSEDVAQWQPPELRSWRVEAGSLIEST